MRPGIIAAPKPDFEGFARTVLRQRPPQRVYTVEMFLDAGIKGQLRERLGIANGDSGLPPKIEYIRQDVELLAALGYDLVRVHLPDSEFRMDVRSSADSDFGDFARTSQGYIVHEHGGPVQNMRDIEDYPWPRIDSLDLSPLEWAEKNLPDGMRAFDMSSQFLECANWLMGYETLMMKMYEDEELVDALLERIGATYLAYTRLLCDFDCIAVIWAADDMGFKTQTFVSPDWLREKILPLHKAAAAIAHAKGKLYFLHSCGKVDTLMDDFIEDVRIDAKHSYEDSVTPVTDIYDRFGSRVGVLGGIDVDFLSRASEDDVRRRVREVLARCHPSGGYALGSGNSITEYVSVDNYLAMLDEAWRWNG